jgi:branched-chain amino acid aminotransferase
MNGSFVEWDKASVPILTHALHYGTAVFEGIRAYKTADGLAVFRLREHMRRMSFSARTYAMQLPYSEDELCEATTALLAKNEMTESSYIRPIAFKATGGISLDFRQVPMWVAIVAFPYDSYFGKHELDACVSSWRKTSEPSVPSLAKASGHYISAALAKVEAAQNGFDEAIILDHRGFVSEGSGENMFIVKDQVIHTPPLAAGILEGITRDTVRTIARDHDFRVLERDIARSELYTCDEAFFTGTAAEVSPIVSIDRRKIGDGSPGPVTRKMQQVYSDVVCGKDERYRHWLTHVHHAAPRTNTISSPIAAQRTTDLATANWQLSFWEWTRPQGP